MRLEGRGGRLRGRNSGAENGAGGGGERWGSAGEVVRAVCPFFLNGEGWVSDLLVACCVVSNVKHKMIKGH